MGWNVLLLRERWGGTEGSNAGTGYQVFDSEGISVGDFTATGSGNITGMYFDWSVGRYATHDGYGLRSGCNTYTWAGGNNSEDSQCYGSVSTELLVGIFPRPREGAAPGRGPLLLRRITKTGRAIGPWRNALISPFISIFPPAMFA